MVEMHVEDAGRVGGYFRYLRIRLQLLLVEVARRALIITQEVEPAFAGARIPDRDEVGLVPVDQVVTPDPQVEVMRQAVAPLEPHEKRYRGNCQSLVAVVLR